ncbi:BolA/IbaG family iron-sulfur metabolism protein [Pigmentibacter sp. JX0631]|uniref:BolA family protein n=1 Tax=Pigmentibacter sp. JX0631 TaxID=2976982 RepID=UPI0024694897|nr:BolA/IbaG family iron-sulfur metabolism protein [Pigmentibacter sp. JX0631]WGL61404.1 BolA/IbaG family iron-sulfur metabolism protein [Pigmentibacter sp. JX0631]
MNIQEKIEIKLKQNLPSILIKVINESYKHSVPKGSETHFKIEVVSNEFENKSLLNRHRLINDILKEEFTLIKACSLHTFTEEEWKKKNNSTINSPNCVGH